MTIERVRDGSFSVAGFKFSSVRFGETPEVGAPTISEGLT